MRHQGGGQRRRSAQISRRLLELLAVLACASLLVTIGSSLASSNPGAEVQAVATSGPTGPSGNPSGPTGPSDAPGNPTSPINPAGHMRKRKCKKTSAGNRKHSKCRHKHRGKGTQHAPGQQK